MDIDKLYEQYLAPNSDNFITSGNVCDLGIPPINDNLTDNKVPLIARPILSLETIGNLNVDNMILQVLFKMDNVVTYYSGLFNFDDYTQLEKEKAGTPFKPYQNPIDMNIQKVREKPCKQFSRIKKLFIKHWYFGELYVAYGQGYVNEELRVLRLGRKNQKTTLQDPDIYPNCKWRLYWLKRDSNGNVTFTSLISGIEGHKLDPKKMVKCGFGGKGLFLQWFDLCKEIVAMERSYVKMAKLATTKVKASVSKADDWINEKEHIFGWDFYYTQKESGVTNEIDPEAFCDITDPKEFMHGNMLYISQRMNMLGMVINPTNKAERMTTGEHYKDLKFASCTESEMLANLSGICEDLNHNFGTLLDVYLTSSLQANGAPKTTQDPFAQFQNQGGSDINSGQINNQF